MQLLASTAEPLVAIHDVVMLDLDGVVYVGPDGVPGAADHLAAARAQGARLAFVTNNASRPPEVVAAHLSRVGVPAAVDDVVSSAQAAARVIRQEHGDAARVVTLGGAGLHEALTAEGLVPVEVGERGVVLATGYGPDVLWSDIMAAAVALRGGLPWVASNTDHTIPTSAGIAPGHGVLVDMLVRFAGVEPTVAGKPAPPLLRTTIERCGAERPLMVGDRIDTDIDGGHAVDVDTLLVMTGVTDATVLAACPVESRPTYLAADLGGLLEAQPAVAVEGGVSAVGGWRAEVTAHGYPRISGSGSDSDWWRAFASAAWSHRDATGEVVATVDLPPVGRDH